MFPKFVGYSVNNQVKSFSVSGRCPACRHTQMFSSAGAIDHAGATQAHGQIVTGQRVCSNDACRLHVFFVHSPMIGPQPIFYPPETIDFDDRALPAPVVAAFEEALTCHAASCYVAAAIMVRKTLEELCKDRGAGGNNLKAKIVDLGTKIVIPPELMTGIDALRLLGNDAAHLESQTYNQVGREELEVAIEVTKELLKATYQLAGLVAKLQAMQKAQQQP